MVLSGILALMTLFVVLGLSAVRESTDRDLQGRTVLAQTAAEHLDFVLSQAANTAAWTASELGPALEAGNQEPVSSLLRDASHHLAAVASGLLLFSPAGELLQSEPAAAGAAHPGLSARARDALDSGKAYAVDWVRRPQGTVAVVVVALTASNGRRLGFLGTALNLSDPSLIRWLEGMTLGKSGQVDVVDGQGVVLVSTARDASASPADHAGYYASLMAEGRPTVTTCYNCHTATGRTDRRLDIMAFAPLQDADWGVVLRQSEAEVLEPTRALQQQVLALGTVALVVALFVAWATTKSVLHPIRALTDSARRIAEGKLSEAVPIQGTDEIGDLGRALEYMRARLEKSMEDIRSCNAELDRRVQERTAELERSRNDLEKSRDYMQTLIDRLSTLNAIAVALNQSLDLETILSGALLNALKLTGMEAGAVYLVDEHTGELELAAHHGLSLEAAQVAANLGLSASLCAAVAQSGQLMVVEDTAKYARGMKSVLLNEKMRCMVRVPFRWSGALLGTMCLGGRTPRSFSPEETDLLVSVSNQIAVAVQNARLYNELQRKERMRGELLEKVISAQEEERKRIARELHDQTSQALAALAMAVETASAQAAAGDDVSASLARMRPLAVETLEEIHRLIFDLRPTLLDDLGLIAALRWYAESRLAEVGVKVRVEIAGQERRLPPQIETALFRVVQEAVNNVVNHSGAQNFTITLVLRSNFLSLVMADDGWGFDLAELSRSQDGKRGLGLMGMRERVELLGGSFAIYSELGGGTKITVEVPLEGGVSDGGGEDTSPAG